MDLITAIVSVISSLLSGGLIIYILERKQKRKERAEEEQKRKEAKREKEQREWQDRVMEGLEIGLENDSVIFKALREHKINGESELQEQKMNQFFRRQFAKVKAEVKA